MAGVTPVPGAIRRLFASFIQGRNGMYSAVLLGVLFFVLYPVLLVFINSFQVGGFGEPAVLGVGNWRDAFGDPRLRATLLNTVSLGLTYQAISLAAGILLAWLIARTDLPGRNWLEFGFWVAFFLPSLPLTLSWILLMDSERGLLNQLLAIIPMLKGFKFDIFTSVSYTHLTLPTSP
jgi:iron(III) transport system permease protein